MCLPETFEVVRARWDEPEPAARPARIDRRTAILAGVGGAVAAAFPGRALGRTTAQTRRQDLTHVFREDFPLFPGTPVTPSRETVVTVPANGFYAQKWTIWEHMGTHMDAPAHFVVGGRTSPHITLQELIVPAAVVDISARVARNPDAVVTPDDLVRFERRHGRIPPHAIVCMYSGWESRAGDPAAYRNIGPDGKMHFPGFSAEAVRWLLDHRAITAIGVDTMSLDPGVSTTFAAHLTLLRANKYGLENLKNLKRIPARGATTYVGLIPWKEGSGGPCRVIASW